MFKDSRVISISTKFAAQVNDHLDKVLGQDPHIADGIIPKGSKVTQVVSKGGHGTCFPAGEGPVQVIFCSLAGAGLSWR